MFLGVLGVLMTIIGALVARSIGHIDTSIKRLESKMEGMAIAVNSGEQLRSFQDRRIRSLERSKEVLTDGFHEMDVLIEKALGKRVKLRRPAEDEEDQEQE